MTDPYQVLGVSPTASDDEVKKAYRTLCKKYHPDANVGKPDAAQAEKKFMEVQQAYEEIMHRRQGLTAQSSGPAVRIYMARRRFGRRWAVCSACL